MPDGKTRGAAVGRSAADPALGGATGERLHPPEVWPFSGSFTSRGRVLPLKMAAQRVPKMTDSDTLYLDFLSPLAPPSCQDCGAHPLEVFYTAKERGTHLCPTCFHARVERGMAKDGEAPLPQEC